MTDPQRVDVHQHVVPPFYAEELPACGGDPSGSATPQWTPESAIEMMDSLQISTGILSVSTPSVVGWPQNKRRQMARRINEYVAELVANHPLRFGSVATLPLPDVDGALAEIDYALGNLRADGVVVLANYEGKYLGDDVFEPLWEKLDRHHAVVFEHPGATPGQPLLPPVTGIAPPMTDFLLETTRTALQLGLRGSLIRYPNVSLILSHAGGFLPYASMRFAELAQVFDSAAPSPDELLRRFHRFYFDTALSSGPALQTLKAFAGSDRMLFGTDSPYDHGRSVAFTAALDFDDSLAEVDRAAINRGNACRLLPRCARRLGARRCRGWSGSRRNHNPALAVVARQDSLNINHQAGADRCFTPSVGVLK
jgi:predicted TIM-barrel fold metal-dependent hydrolase